MINSVDHIAIAVKSLDDKIPFYRDILGLKFLGTEEVPSQKVKVAFFTVGDTHIELLEPISSESPIAAFLEKKGEGIHHIAYKVDDINKSIEEMKAKGLQMIDHTPRPGAHGNQIAFIHPKSTFSVLTELCSKEDHK